MEVKWFSFANRDLYHIRYYCEANFGKKKAKNIVTSILNTVNLLGKFPNMGPLEPLLSHRAEPWRSLVIHRNTKVIYLIGANTINIAALWDTRQRPNRLAGYIDRLVKNEPSVVNEPLTPYLTTPKENL